MEEDIKILEGLVKGIYKYGFDYDVDGEKHDIIRYEEFKALENLIKGYRELEEKSKQKPYWEQTMNKEKMTTEEAETIIDDMYQDRNKIISTQNDKGVTIHLDKLDEVQFTNLEFASVRTLREIRNLRRKLENSVPKSKIKEKIEELKEMNLDCETFGSMRNYAILILQELMEDK